MTDFSKGDLVTVIAGWTDGEPYAVRHKASTPVQFSYVNAVVSSCGKQRMVLANEDNGVAHQRFYQPLNARLRGPLQGLCARNVYPRMTADDAAEEARKVAELFRGEQHAWWTDPRRAKQYAASPDMLKEMIEHYGTCGAEGICHVAARVAIAAKHK